MKEISNVIKYKDKEYKVVFNLNVMEQIQDEYGTLDKWGKLTDGSEGEPNIKALIFGFTCMINEGIEIDNDDNGTDNKLFTQKQIGRLMQEVGLEEMTKVLTNTVTASTKSAEKNA